jgi:hypothetical protein
VRAEEERHAKEREAQSEQLKRQEEQLQAEQRDQLAKIEAAKKAQMLESARQKEALEKMQKQAAATVARVATVPDDVAFTPIAAGKGGGGFHGGALDTPATLQIKDDLNIEAMLGQLDLDLDMSKDSRKPIANKNLQVANSTMSRDSTARELEGLDNLMAGMDAFSFDTSVASTPAKQHGDSAAKVLNDSRTGGLTIRDPVKVRLSSFFPFFSWSDGRCL